MSLMPSITVGNSLFNVSKINYSQKLILGGSLKFNIVEIISITGAGEMQLTSNTHTLSPDQHMAVPAERFPGPGRHRPKIKAALVKGAAFSAKQLERRGYKTNKFEIF